MYDAVVFDVDGVILRRHPDYPSVYRDAVRDAFRAFDVDPSPEDVESFFGGASKSLAEMRATCDRHDIDLETFWPERERRSAALQRRMIERGDRVLYDDVSVLSTLAETHALGFVSSNQHETIEFVVEHFDLADDLETFHGRRPTVDGFERTKPDTHYLDAALDDLETRDALYVGDGGHDVVAAHRAGLDSAFVWRDHRDGYDLPESPTHEVDRLTDLLDVI
ncbi:HAD family hydrolase [Halorubellus litoreus]|uniref:HAD family hydrolase n=1 Tax=Halorubellus litoreus TaxID=755308 RepID=A0ABD5VCU4_9EURY